MLTPRHSDTTPIPRNKPSIADLTVKAVTGRHGTDTSSFPPNKRNQSTKRNRASFPRSRDGLIGTSCRSSSYLFTDEQSSGRPEENYPFNATRFFFALRCPLTRRANYRPIPLEPWRSFSAFLPTERAYRYIRNSRRAISRFLPTDPPVSPEHRRYVGN